jgi:hypothetical protein
MNLPRLNLRLLAFPGRVPIRAGRLKRHSGLCDSVYLEYDLGANKAAGFAIQAPGAETTVMPADMYEVRIANT